MSKDEDFQHLLKLESLILSVLISSHQCRPRNTGGRTVPWLSSRKNSCTLEQGPNVAPM